MVVGISLERKTGFEPATFGLGSFSVCRQCAVFKLFMLPYFLFAGGLQVSLFHQQEQVGIPLLAEFPHKGLLYLLSCDFVHSSRSVIFPLPVSSQVADIP